MKELFMKTEFEVFYEATPNPQSMKFNITKEISKESIHFTNPLTAGRSPLAQKLFGFPWTQAVFIGTNFVTITKQEWVDWKVLADPLVNLIVEHLERGESVLLSAVTPPTATIDSNEHSHSHSHAHSHGHTHGHEKEEKKNKPQRQTSISSHEHSPDDSPTVKKIKDILNNEVRPAVAQDGGDIVFIRYENNRLYLSLQGACSGCPSSTITLKNGVEVRMKSAIPELIEVISE
jgi:Fe-S cluster biogenesis protein NfuA